MQLLLACQVLVSFCASNPVHEPAHQSFFFTILIFCKSPSELVLDKVPELMKTDLQASCVLIVLFSCLRDDLSIAVASKRLDAAGPKSLVVENSCSVASVRNEFGNGSIINGM